MGQWFYCLHEAMVLLFCLVVSHLSESSELVFAFGRFVLLCYLLFQDVLIVYVHSGCPNSAWTFPAPSILMLDQYISSMVKQWKRIGPALQKAWGSHQELGIIHMHSSHIRAPSVQRRNHNIFSWFGSFRKFLCHRLICRIGICKNFS